MNLRRSLFETDSDRKPPEKGALVVAALAAGESPRDVAARFGIKLKTVYCYRYRYGVRNAEHGKKGPQVAEAIAAGGTIKDVAARFGIGTETVYTYCYRFGVHKKRPRGQFKDEIPQMYRDGLTVTQIVDMTHTDRRTVAKWLRAAGLTPKDRGINTIEFWREQLAKTKQVG